MLLLILSDEITILQRELIEEVSVLALGEEGVLVDEELGLYEILLKCSEHNGILAIVWCYDVFGWEPMKSGYREGVIDTIEELC